MAGGRSGNKSTRIVGGTAGGGTARIWGLVSSGLTAGGLVNPETRNRVLWRTQMRAASTGDFHE